MKADLLKTLLQTHADGDEVAFRKAALQLASSESSAGHGRVAEELRAILAKMPPVGPHRASSIVDIAQPRGDLADILEGRHRDERLRNVVLPGATRAQIERVLRENRSRGRLERWGVGPRRRLLFHGPPGTGKTLTAAAMAGELGLPLMVVQLSEVVIDVRSLGHRHGRQGTPTNTDGHSAAHYGGRVIIHDRGDGTCTVGPPTRRLARLPASS